MEYLAIILFSIFLAAIYCYIAFNVSEDYFILSLLLVLAALLILVLTGGIVQNVTNLDLEGSASVVNVTHYGDALQKNANTLQRVNIWTFVIIMFFAIVTFMMRALNQFMDKKEEKRNG